MEDDSIDPVRRRVMQMMLAVPAFTIAACGANGDSAAQTLTAPGALNPTPACADDDDDPTPSQTEGPYFTSNSPQRTSLLEAGPAGTSGTFNFGLAV